MGELTDYLTGDTLPDTHDERLRQDLARHLVEQCGFSRDKLCCRYPVKIHTGARIARIHIDFLVKIRPYPPEREGKGEAYHADAF